MQGSTQISNAVKNQGISGDIYAMRAFHSPSDPHYDEGLGYSLDLDECAIIETNKKWVRYGTKDNVPDLLHDLAKRSSIHKSCLNVKTNLITGGGFDFIPLDEFCELNAAGLWEFRENQMSDAQFEAEKMKARAFAKNALFENYLKSAAMNLAWYGGYYGIRSYYQKTDGNVGLRRVWIHDYRNGRLSVKRDWINDDFNSTRHYFSKNFVHAYTSGMVSYSEMADSVGTNKNVMTTLAVDVGQAYERQRTGTYSSFHKRHDAARTYYATADYETQDTLTYIGIDYLLGVDDLKSIKEGFSVDHIIVRIRSRMPDQDEEQKKQAEEYEMFKSKLTGAAGKRSMITWVEPERDETGKIQTQDPWKIIEIPHQNNPDRRNILREERLLKILNGHSIVTGEIVGLPRLQNGSGFSSQAEYLIHAQEQLYWNTIRPMQEIILNDIQNILLREKIYVKPVIKKSTANFKMLTEKLLMWAYGKDEIRVMNGDEAMSDETRMELAAQVVSQLNQQERSAA